MASNTIDLHLNIQNALKQNLQENKKEMSSFNDKLSKSEGLSEKLSSKMGSVGDKVKTSVQSMSRFGLTLQRIIPAFSVIFGGGFIVDTVKEVMDLNQAMMDTAHQMGMSAQGVKQLEDAVSGTMDEPIHKNIQASVNTTGIKEDLQTAISEPIHKNIQASVNTTGIKEDLQTALVDATEMGAEKSKDILTSKMEQGFKKTVRSLENAVYGVVQATGLATDKAQELVTGLAQLHVGIESIEALATASARFSEITGVSTDATTRLSGELMRTGRLGEEATQQILFGMASVQRAVGMSTAEMQQLTETIQETTKLLNQMSKSAGEIEQFNKGVVQLSGAFASAGIEAGEASKFVNELLDPSQVEENAFLYSKLGISMEDAFSGNVSPQKLIPRFKELGQELKNMSGPAAASMAKSLGMPLATLRQMGEIDMSQQREMMKMMSEEGKSMEEAMASMQNEQEGAGRSFEDSINKLKGSIQPLISKFLIPFINKFANMIEHINIEGIVETLSSVFGTVMKTIKRFSFFLKPATFVAGAIALMVIIKKIRKKFYTMATGVKKDLQTALVGATEIGAEKSKGVFTSKMEQGFKETRRGLENAVSGTMDEHTETIYKNIQASVNATGTLRKEKIAEYRASQQNVEAERSQYQTRIDYLDAQRKSGELTARQTREFGILTKWQKDSNKDAQTFNNRRLEANSRLRRQQENQMKFLSDEQLRNYKREMEQNKAIAEQQAAASTERMQDLNTQNKRIEDRLADMKTQGKYTAQDLEEIEKLNSWLKNNNAQIEQAKQERLESVKAATEQRKQERQINQIYQKRTGMDLDVGEGATEAKATRGVFQKVGDRIKAAGRSMGSSVYKGFAKVQNKFAETREKIADVFAPRNLKKTLGKAMKAGGSGVAKGMKGLGKGMLKLTGPMVVLGMVMALLRPAIEALQPVIQAIQEVLMGAIGKIFKALMPAILKILSALIPVLAALVNTLLPPLLYVLGTLVKIIGFVITAIQKMIEGISKLPFVGDKLDGVISTMGEISGSIGGAGQALQDVGKKYMDPKNKLIDDDTVAGLQDSIDSTGDKIANGEITLKPSKTAGAGGGAATSTSTSTTTWTPAMLSAGKKGISVEEHAKRTTKTAEQKQAQAQAETAEATKETAKATKETNEELAKVLEEYTKAKQEQRSKRNTEKAKNNLEGASSILGVRGGSW